MTHKISVIICAAGKGERAGFGKNKLLAPLYGAPALWHTLKKFDINGVDEVIVTSSKTDLKEITALCKPFGYKTVIGGKTRTESVKNALKAVTGDVVLIHDGARPFVTEKIIRECIDSVLRFSSGVCAVKLTDTAVLSELGEITERIDRERAYRVQTPQGFFTEDIKRAYALAKNKIYTDDSAVYGEFIAPPRLVEDSESNIKLTFKSDYPQYMPQITGFGDIKIGFGADVHAFGEGDSVTLGGVKIPCDRGLVAHSDGDVPVHALMDALLSAAGLKDIGHYFPVEDEAYSGVYSVEMLKKVVGLLKERGLKPRNISITIQAEKPRLAPHIDKMREVLSEACGTEEIAVAAGTTEGLGFVGEGLGIAAYAAVTVVKE